MRSEVTAASRHRHLVVYDPAAIPAEAPLDPDLEAQDPKPPPEAAIHELAQQGQALVLSIPSEDCEARLQLLVDEEPDARHRELGSPVLRSARLQVPSGRLLADGVEFLCRAGQVRKHSEAEAVSLPPGQYDVDVFALLSWKLSHRAGEIGSRTSGRDRVARRATAAYTWLGIVLIPANVLLAPRLVAFLWKQGGWRRGLSAAAVILAVDAIVVAGFWLLAWAQKRFPWLTLAAHLDARFEAEHPDAVIVLRRSANDGPAAAVAAFARLLPHRKGR